VRAASVRSFDDYKSFIPALVKDVSALHGLRFGTWCIKRFLETFGAENDLWDGLAQTEHQQLEAIIAELEATAVAGQVVTGERATQLEAILEPMGLPDEDDLPRVEPNTIALLTMIDNTLRWCRHTDPSSLCVISEEFVNAWDFEQDDDDYRLENMFTYPDLRRELELQEAFLNS
jgi:hypothetical protein